MSQFVPVVTHFCVNESDDVHWFLYVLDLVLNCIIFGLLTQDIDCDINWRCVVVYETTIGKSFIHCHVVIFTNLGRHIYNGQQICILMDIIGEAQDSCNTGHVATVPPMPRRKWLQS